jgi:hypothetical protein
VVIPPERGQAGGSAFSSWAIQVDGVRPPAGRDAKNERINIALLKTWSAPGA